LGVVLRHDGSREVVGRADELMIVGVLGKNLATGSERATYINSWLGTRSNGVRVFRGLWVAKPE